MFSGVQAQFDALKIPRFFTKYGYGIWGMCVGEVPTDPPKSQNRRNDMKLQEALKGMKVKNWEIRESSNGKRVVYVRFVENEKPVTVNVD